MALLFGLVLLASGGNALVLKERAEVCGRYVRLADVVEAKADGASVPGIYLGRAPHVGDDRIIDAEVIRREIERAGSGAEGCVLEGAQAVVVRRIEPIVGEELRSALVTEIKLRLLDRREDLKPGELEVRIVATEPARLPDAGEVAEVRERFSAVADRAAFDVSIVPAPGETAVDAQVTVRVCRMVERPVASRDIASGTSLKAEDIEMRRIEAGPEDRAENAAAFAGGLARVRISQGAVLTRTMVRVRPAVRARDLIRVESPWFEVDARALEDGAVGDEIGIEYTATKRRARAVVKGPAEVRIEECE